MSSWCENAMIFWVANTLTLDKLHLAVHNAGGYDCRRCEWHVDAQGRPFLPREVGTVNGRTVDRARDR